MPLYPYDYGVPNKKPRFINTLHVLVTHSAMFVHTCLCQNGHGQSLIGFYRVLDPGSLWFAAQRGSYPDA